MQGLLVEARDRLITFATSEWLELAPDLVRGLRQRLPSRLAPGVSIGDELPLPARFDLATLSCCSGHLAVVRRPSPRGRSADVYHALCQFGKHWPACQASDDGAYRTALSSSASGCVSSGALFLSDDAPLPPTAATFAPPVALPLPRPVQLLGSRRPPSFGSRASCGLHGILALLPPLPRFQEAACIPSLSEVEVEVLPAAAGLSEAVPRVAGSAICVLCQSTGSECVPSTSASFVSVHCLWFDVLLPPQPLRVCVAVACRQRLSALRLPPSCRSSRGFSCSFSRCSSRSFSCGSLLLARLRPDCRCYNVSSASSFACSCAVWGSSAQMGHRASSRWVCERSPSGPLAVACRDSRCAACDRGARARGRRCTRLETPIDAIARPGRTRRCTRAVGRWVPSTPRARVVEGQG